MQKLGALTAAAALAVVLGFGGTAQADEFADAKESFTPPFGCELFGVAGNGNDCDISGDNGDNGTDARFADNGNAGDNTTFTSLGFTNDTIPGGALTPEGGVLILTFTDNVCLDGTGNDFKVFEVGTPEDYDVTVGPGGGTAAGPGTGDTEFESPVVGFNRISITATDGEETNDTGGPDIDAVECFFTLDVADIEKDTVVHGDDTGGGHTGDKDTVFFGLDTQQFKAFTITITNNTGEDGGLAGLIFIDATGAEWDLDPVEEDDVNSCDGNGEVCDGVDVTAADDDVADCTATGAEHTTQGKSGKEKLQPDIITMTADGLDDGDSCTITVWVMTDLKKGGTRPGRGNSPVFAPTDCPVPLNDGVKVFDASMNLLLRDDDELIFSDVVDSTCEIPS